MIISVKKTIIHFVNFLAFWPQHTLLVHIPSDDVHSRNINIFFFKLPCYKCVQKYPVCASLCVCFIACKCFLISAQRHSAIVDLLIEKEGPLNEEDKKKNGQEKSDMTLYLIILFHILNFHQLMLLT